MTPADSKESRAFRESRVLMASLDQMANRECRDRRGSLDPMANPDSTAIRDHHPKEIQACRGQMEYPGSTEIPGRKVSRAFQR